MAVHPIVRTDLADLVAIEARHASYYVEHGPYEEVFSDYVRKGVQAFRRAFDPARDAVWTVPHDGALLGYVAIAHHAEGAQLRWFFVEPAWRGEGLGARLLDTALSFARQAGYKRVFLWTMDDLPAARRLYERAGFVLTEEAEAPWAGEGRQHRFELTFT